MSGTQDGAQQGLEVAAVPAAQQSTGYVHQHERSKRRQQGGNGVTAQCYLHGGKSAAEEDGNQRDGGDRLKR
jgi:hypothetical protein